MPSDLVDRGEVVRLARAMIGTPYRHQGRVPGRALDCVGLLICVANAAGLEDAFDCTNYPKYPLNAEVGKSLAAKAALVPGGLGEARDADIALFTDQQWATHTGWLATQNGQRSVIHAYALARCVVEHPLDSDWRRRVVAVYRHPRIR